MMGRMDGISGTMDIAASGTSAIAASLLASTERLVADEAARLMASLGIGTNFSATA